MPKTPPPDDDNALAPADAPDRLSPADADARVRAAWRTAHEVAARTLGAHRQYEPFTYEAGLALIVALEAAAPDPTIDLDALALEHIHRA